MSPRTSCSVVAQLIALLIALTITFSWAATPAQGKQTQWINPAGGEFSNSANWDAGIPDSETTAVFELPNVYGVNLTGDANVLAWQQTAGDVMLSGGQSLNSGSVSVNGSSLSLSGDGTQLLGDAPLSVGTLQSAAINVNSSNTLTSNQGILGSGGGSFGSVTVSGNDANWLNSGALTINNGSLAIDNGGLVSNGLATIGDTSGAGLVTVSGAGSRWKMSSVAIATYGTGAVRVENGGNVEGSAFIGRYGTGSVVISGEGSHWFNGASGDFRVGWGSGGNGTLTIENGGTATGRAGSIGDASGSIGTVNVTGPGSSWTTSLQLIVGSQGDGTMTISEGGYVSNQTGTLATTNRGTANVTVTGDGSHWNLENGLRLSQFGSGVLNIEDGGLVTVGANVNGAITTIGETSKVNLNGGRFEFASMSVDSLSRVCGDSGVLVGRMEASDGYRHIDSLDVENLINFDTSDVRFTNAGVVFGTGVTQLGLENVAEGELRAVESDFMRIRGHSYNAGEINNFGGVIRFGQTLTNHADGMIAGRGHFETANGLLNAGVMAFSGGPAEIFGDVEIQQGGQVVTSGGDVTTFFGDVVHNGLEIRTAAGSQTVFFGELSGEGALTGEGLIRLGGALRPGNSPGILSFEGDLQFEDSVDSFFELAGNDAGLFDQLLVAGDLQMGGTLSVSVLDGFELNDGDEFLIAMIDGELTGQFSGLAEGDWVGKFSNANLYISYGGGDGNDVALFATAVPEPNVFGVLILVVAMYSVRRHSKRR